MKNEFGQIVDDGSMTESEYFFEESELDEWQELDKEFQDNEENWAFQDKYDAWRNEY